MQRFQKILVLTCAVAFGCGQPASDTSADAGTPDKRVEQAAQAPSSSNAKAPGDPVQAIDAFIASQNIDKSSPSWKTSLPKPPQVAFEAKSYYWDVETNVGKLVIKLMPEIAPMHVSSLIYLTRLGFYDGLSFHRVIPGFMAQGGDPLGNGRGNPGYRFGGEFDPKSKHDRPGLLSMANAGPGTDGSQFFLTFVPTPHLNGKHTIFGEVTDGMATVKELEAWRSRGSAHLNDPLEMLKATIRVE